MSQAQSIAATFGSAAEFAQTDVRGAIARAADATGVDFKYLLAQAKLESSLDPGARAGSSSAAGLYQFTGGTWLQTLGRHGAAHGLDWAGAAITSGRVRDPSTRSQIMALRLDADTSAMMAAELARDNAAQLAPQLGREPDSAELYLAHFLGAGGARQFLAALADNPGHSAASLLPAAADANPAIFRARGGSPRSVSEVMNLLRTRLATTSEGPDAASPPNDEAVTIAALDAPALVSRAPRAPFARAFHALRAAAAPADARMSMADTLGSAFGTASQGAAATPVFVNIAYSRLQALGL